MIRFSFPGGFGILVFVFCEIESFKNRADNLKNIFYRGRMLWFLKVLFIFRLLVVTLLPSPLQTLNLEMSHQHKTVFQRLEEPVVVAVAGASLESW